MRSGLTIKRLLLQLCKAILFFMFFESFAVYNFVFAGNEFGLQFSWFLSLIFSFLFFVYKLNHGKLGLQKIRHTSELFFVLFVASFLGQIWILCQKDMLIEISGSIRNLVLYTANMQIRSLTHTIYIVFLFFASALIGVFLLECLSYQELLRIVKKYAITAPYFFIGIWGIYQWLSTYNVVPYFTIFNNSISTGFTYERFRYSHRTSSVFPEPSEYTYFLGLYFPIVISYVFGKTNLFSLKKTVFNKLLVLGFYLFQTFIIQSFSLYVAIPFLIIIAVNKSDMNKKGKLIFNILFLIFVGLFIGALFVLYTERFQRILSGTDASFLVRFNYIILGMNMFRKSPLFGMGYGFYRAMDLVSGTFSYFGLMGVAALIVFVFRMNKKAKKDPHSNVLFTGYMCFLVTGCVGNSLFEILPFWLIPVLTEALCKKREVFSMYNSEKNVEG